MKRIIAILAALLLAGLPALAVGNGIYAAEIAVEGDAPAFADAVALVSDAGVTLRLTAAGGIGETLYAGGAEIAPAVNAEGAYTYTLALPDLDNPEPLEWADADGARHGFTLAVASEGLRPLLPGAAPAAESGDAWTALADGEYAAADFSYSGGTGRVTLRCDGVSVRGGAATARIVFSSPHYAYVKVDGVRYDGEHTADSSAFDLPVRLGEETRILGMTTAMSRPHEIAYALRVTPGERIGD